MKTVTLSATQARNQFFDIIKAAFYSGQTTEIVNEKTRETMAVVSQKKKDKQFDWAKHIKSLQDMKPFLTDEDVAEYERLHEELNTPRFPDW